MEIEIDFLRKGYMNGEEYFPHDMASTFIGRFRGIVVTVDRPILFKFHSEELQGKIKSVSLRGASSASPTGNDTRTGIIFTGTDVIFTAATNATIRIRPNATRFRVAASTFAGGMQTINIYGGNFYALSPTCPCAIAERCLAAGSMTSKVNLEVQSLASSDSKIGNSAYLTFVLDIFVTYIISTQKNMDMRNTDAREQETKAKAIFSYLGGFWMLLRAHFGKLLIVLFEFCLTFTTHTLRSVLLFEAHFQVASRVQQAVEIYLRNWRFGGISNLFILLWQSPNKSMTRMGSFKLSIEVHAQSQQLPSRSTWCHANQSAFAERFGLKCHCIREVDKKIYRNTVEYIP